MIPTSAQRPKRPRATPRSSPSRIVMVDPPPKPLLRVFVPGNPSSGNHLYLSRKRGQGVKPGAKTMTPTAKAWREAVAVSVMPWRFPESAPRPTLSVACIFIGARADVDNLLKGALDGLKDGLLVDDRYVMKVSAEKRPLTADTERGAWIEVTCLPPTSPQPRKRKTAQP